MISTSELKTGSDGEPYFASSPNLEGYFVVPRMSIVATLEEAQSIILEDYKAGIAYPEKILELLK
jgi:hypothetical protein